MKLPVIRFSKYPITLISAWAFLFSLTLENFAFQFGPFRLYVGWTKLDGTLQ